MDCPAVPLSPVISGISSMSGTGSTLSASTVPVVLRTPLKIPATVPVGPSARLVMAFWASLLFPRRNRPGCSGTDELVRIWTCTCANVHVFSSYINPPDTPQPGGTPVPRVTTCRRCNKFCFSDTRKNKLRAEHSHRWHPPDPPRPSRNPAFATYRPILLLEIREPTYPLSCRELIRDMARTCLCARCRGPGLASIWDEARNPYASPPADRVSSRRIMDGFMDPFAAVDPSSLCLSLCGVPGLSSGTPDHSAASQPCVTAWSGQHAQKADTSAPRLSRRCESLRDLRWLAMFSRSHFAGPLARCRKKRACRKQYARTRPLVAMNPTT